jgi:hypothetical protein
MIWRHLATGLAGVALTLSLSAPAEAQPARRTVFASVLDHNGAPVSNVSPDDLVVREDKVVREVLDVWPATEPMDIALLVDDSQASDSFIRDYREALPAFINALAADEGGARHQVAVITLADRPTIRADYSPDLANAAKAVSNLFAQPGSGTYLLDGIIETSRGLAKRSSERPVIVVVTTEGPELSDRAYQSVLEPLRAAGASLHIIVVGRPVNNNNDRSIVLSMGTKDTGGSYDNLLTSNGLPARMKKLAAELTHQFKVTYSRPDSLIPPEQVTIGPARPNTLTVRGLPARVVTTQERR